MIVKKSWFVRLSVLVLFMLGAGECNAAAATPISISSTGSSCIGLLSDGTVWTWGNGQALPGQVPQLTGIKQATSIGGGCVALASDGTVWLWNNNGSAPVRLPMLTDVKQISGHSFLKNDGTVWIWSEGRGDGKGNILYLSDPVQVPGLTDVVMIDDCSGLKKDGTLWEWGIVRASNSYYYSFEDITPVQVPLTDVKAFADDPVNAVALKNDGTVWAWGRATNLGAREDGQDNKVPVPVQVSELKDIVAISKGSDHFLALDKDGTLWGWGSNQYCQLGALPVGNHNTPIKISVDNIGQFFAAGDNSYVVKKDGSLWGWGLNSRGQLGDGTICDPGIMDPKNHGKESPVRVLIDTVTVTSPTTTPIATPAVTPTQVIMTPSPTATVQPSVIGSPVTEPAKPLVSPTPVPLPDVSAEPAPGFGFNNIAILCILFIIAGLLLGLVRRGGR